MGRGPPERQGCQHHYYSNFYEKERRPARADERLIKPIHTKPNRSKGNALFFFLFQRTTPKKKERKGGGKDRNGKRTPPPSSFPGERTHTHTHKVSDVSTKKGGTKNKRP